jgi:hypothetical protein
MLDQVPEPAQLDPVRAVPAVAIELPGELGVFIPQDPDPSHAP